MVTFGNRTEITRGVVGEMTIRQGSDDFTRTTRNSDSYNYPVFVAKQALINALRDNNMNDNDVQILMSVIVLCDRVRSMSTGDFRQAATVVLMDIFMNNGVILYDNEVILLNTIITLLTVNLMVNQTTLESVNATVILLKDIILMTQQNGGIVLNRGADRGVTVMQGSDDFTRTTRNSNSYNYPVFVAGQTVVDILKDNNMNDNDVQILMSIIVLCDRVRTMSVGDFCQATAVILMDIIVMMTQSYDQPQRGGDARIVLNCGTDRGVLRDGIDLPEVWAEHDNEFRMTRNVPILIC